MKIDLIWVGKTQDPFVVEGINHFRKRIERFVTFDIVEVKTFKNWQNVNTLKEMEGKEILKKLENYQKIILLDENGKQFNSRAFAQMIDDNMAQGVRNMCFIIGGAYGFSDEVYQKAHMKISLSKMTFNHQVVRLMFTEQLYRAFSIINKSPYHHD